MPIARNGTKRYAAAVLLASAFAESAHAPLLGRTMASNTDSNADKRSASANHAASKPEKKTANDLEIPQNPNENDSSTIARKLKELDAGKRFPTPLPFPLEIAIDNKTVDPQASPAMDLIPALAEQSPSAGAGFGTAGGFDPIFAVTPRSSTIDGPAGLTLPGNKRASASDANPPDVYSLPPVTAVPEPSGLPIAMAIGSVAWMLKRRRQSARAH